MPAGPLDRQKLLAELAPRIGEVIERAIERTKRGEVAEDYAEISSDELRQGINRDLGRAVAAFAENRPLNDVERAALGQIGDRRALQGVPLDAMLQVYRYTIDEIFNELWVAGEAGTMAPGDVMLLTRDLWRYADPVIDAAVQGYRRREVLQAVADTQGRTALVHALLLSPGGAASADPVLAAQLNPNADYVAFRARSSSGDVRALLLELQTPGALPAGAVAPHEGDVIGFAVRRPTLGPLDGVTIGVGPAGPVSALPHSLVVATRVVETAASYRQTGIHTLEQVGLQAIARSEDLLGDHLVRRHIERCEPRTPAGAELLQTIAAYLEHELSIDATATALFVHPNTVRNRLRRFERLTGSSMRNVDDLFGVRLALLRYELAEK